MGEDLEDGYGSLVKASSAKGMEEKEGRFISGMKGTFPQDLHEALSHTWCPCCFQAEQSCLQDRYK